MAQKRYLTDEEFIGIAIRNQVYADRLGIGASEESVSNFHMNHPKCCRVDRKQAASSLLDKLTGFYAIDVEVNFAVKEQQRLVYGQYYEGHAIVNPCGEIDRTYGTNTETLHEIANLP